MTPVTRYRKTHVTLGEYKEGCIQPLFAFEREAAIWTLTTDNLEYVPGIGVQLRPYQATPDSTFMLSEGVAGVQDVAGGLLTVAGRMAEYNSFRKATELTGVTYSGSVISAGSKVLQKRVGAGQSFDSEVAGDVVLMPKVEPGEDPVNMDRVIVSAADHNPLDTLHFSFFVPGGGLALAQGLVNFYFSSVPGSTKKYIGNGQYAIKLRASGDAALYERCVLSGDTPGDLTWRLRKRFQWIEPSLVYGRRHYFRIESNARSNSIGTAIAFYTGVGVSSVENGLIGLVAEAVALDIRKQAKSIPIYRIPHIFPGSETFTAAKFRADIRRDVRCVMQIAKSTYPETATFVDQLFTSERPFYGGTVKLELLGFRPTGTSFSMRLLKSDGSVIGSPSTITDNAAAGKVISYAVPSSGAPLRGLQVEVTLTANTAKTKTPFVTAYRVIVEPVYETPDVASVTIGGRGSGVALPRSSASNLSITYSDREPQSETANLTIHDMVDEASLLRNRGHVPILIETEYNVGGDRCVLFEGFIQRAVANRLTGKKAGRNYPSAEFRRYEIQAIGQWLTLGETHAPKRFSWVDVQGSGQNLAYKVTDIIRTLLRSVLPDSKIDVPDRPTRYINLGDQTALMFEPGNEIGQYCNDLAHDFLGGWLTYDANAGSAGMWRLKFPKVAPFNPLAIFEIDHPGAGKLAFADGVFPTLPEWPNAVRLPVRRRTWSEYVEPPEGNIVVVHGFDSQAEGESKLITNVAINVNSYNFLNLPSSSSRYPTGSSPDFLGRFRPIYVFDPTYGSQEIVDYVTRRVYDAACHAVKYITFEAPLGLVTDPDDTNQRCPRPLAFYDPVKLRLADGSLEDWLILSCQPSYRKDHIQMARYTIIRPSNLNTSLTANAFQQGPGGYRRDLERFMKRMAGKSRRDSINTAAAQSLLNRKQDWLGLPEAGSSYLQDLDPASSTFGEFI